MLFANTNQQNTWELSTRLFVDPHMSPALLKGGFIQIGNPHFYNYDPICFDSNGRGGEYRVVQLDHEAILQFGGLSVVEETAPSFVDVLNRYVAA